MLVLVLLLLIKATDSKIIYKEVSDLGMSRPKSPGWHVWAVFLFVCFLIEADFLSFTFHFLPEESVFIPRSNDLKTHWRENETTRIPREIWYIYTCHFLHSLGPLLFLVPFSCYRQHSLLNGIIYPLTWQQLSSEKSPRQFREHLHNAGDLHFQQPSRKPGLNIISCQLVHELCLVKKKLAD